VHYNATTSTIKDKKVTREQISAINAKGLKSMLKACLMISDWCRSK